ncbi:hypothetical protein ACLIMP_06260 [Novosphingobium aerophilum]|uniref:hypothetical protein n=1 Tax=Novosphingobium aerophilum TaxID=2839843 RepID=UPI003FD6645B
MSRRSTHTSRAALASMGSEADTLRAISYRLIHEAGARGMTALEVVDASGRDRWGIQPRISELVSAKRVIDSGRTRTNPSGRQAIVWIVPDLGSESREALS